MAISLARGARIGAPQADGTLIAGSILGPAFGNGFYCASFAYPDGNRIVCVHRSELVIEPQFASLTEAAEAMRIRDERAVAVRQLKVSRGAF